MPSKNNSEKQMLSQKFIARVQDKLARESHRTLKRFYHLKNKNNAQKRLMFVMGCQRSGTTLMMHILEKDYATSIYHEQSILSSGDKVEHLRLNALDYVQKVLTRDRAYFIVLKPLVESQRTTALLDVFSNAKALWMYRSYHDVVNSNLKRFGLQNGISDIRPIAQGDSDNWRSTGVSAHVRAIVQEHFAEGMNPYDAGALFWFARNSLYFEQNLAQNPHVMLCNYRDLALKPLRFMQELYHFMEQDFPGAHIVADVKDSSVGRGKHVELSPAVEELCANLYERMDAVYATTEQYQRIHADEATETSDMQVIA